MWVFRVIRHLAAATTMVVVPFATVPAKDKTIGDVLKNIGKEKKFEKEKKDIPKGSEAFKTAAPVNLSTVKPPRSSDIYRVEGDGKEVEYEKLTDRAIKDTFAIVNKFKNSPNRGELWVRLAELYVEKARLVKFRRYREYEVKLDDFEAKKSKIKPQLDLSEGREYNQRAINLYKLFLQDFPKDKKIAQVLFFLGYNYYEVGREDEGAKYYRMLTENYTKSIYVDESNFALGDYYFEKNQWVPAAKHYSRLVNNQKGRHYLFSIYKLSWCKYRLNDVKGALKGMELVFNESRRFKDEERDEKGKVSSLRLASEALRDMVPFYAEVGSYKNAPEYFTAMAGEKKALKILDKLAYYFMSRNIEGARFLFRHLIDAEPNSPRSFDFQYQIVSMYATAGKGSIFKKELYDWISGYGPESEWAKANKKDQGLLDSAYEQRERTLRNYVLGLHDQSRKSANPEVRRQTVEWYKLYLVSFEKSANIADMHFYYGELLYDDKQYKEAAREYSWVVENDKKSKFYKDAVLNQVISLERIIPNQQAFLQRRDKSPKNEPIPIAEEVNRFLNAAGLFVKTFRDDPKVTGIEYKIAQIYYLHNNFDKAIDYFTPIIKKEPKSAAGQDAISFVLDIYNRSQDFIRLRKASEDLLAIPEVAASPIALQLRKVLVNSKFTNSVQLQEKKEFYAAGQSFEKFAAENNKSDLTIKALFNAAYNYRQAKAIGPALKMFEAVIAFPDKSPEAMKLKKDASLELPPLYQQLGNYSKAAQGYEAYALAHPGEKQVENYHFNAAVIYDGLMNYDNAIKNYEAYFRKEKRQAERVESIYYQAEIWKKRGNLIKAIKLYQQYIYSPVSNKERVVESHYKLYQLYLKDGDKQNANRWRDKTIRIQDEFAKSDRGLGGKYAADARFNQVKEIYEELKSVALPAEARKQKSGIEKRDALTSKLQKEIGQIVVKYTEGNTIVASWTLLGLAYMNNAQAIRAMPVPPDVRKALGNPQKVKEYQGTIENQFVKPREQKSIESFQLAVDEAKKLDVMNEHVIAARKNLSKFDPGQNLFVNANIKSINLVDWMGF